VLIYSRKGGERVQQRQANNKTNANKQTGNFNDKQSAATASPAAAVAAAQRCAEVQRKKKQMSVRTDRSRTFTGACVKGTHFFSSSLANICLHFHI
jgi:hypothetical protein